jgi:hypothetical protein
MQYIREILTRLGAETLLGEAEAALTRPETEAEERLAVAQRLRDLREVIFGTGARRGVSHRPLPPA